MDRDLNSARVINYRPILVKALNSASSNFDSEAVKAREGHSRRNAFGGVASTFQRGMQTTPVNQEHTLQLAGEAHTFSGGKMSQ